MPVPGLTHLETTAIQNMLTVTPVIILAVNLSLCSPLIEEYMDG
jgi:hypothetical protein